MVDGGKSLVKSGVIIDQCLLAVEVTRRARLGHDLLDLQAVTV
jgi:hypothetical protein